MSDREPRGRCEVRARRAYIVDDDEGFRRSLAELLASAGWEVDEFASPAAFLERSGGLEPGMLLLDLNMPETTGLDLIESELPELDRFAIVMMTGAGAIETAVRTMRAGALDFIEKPAGPDELLERLELVQQQLQVSLREKGEAIDARARVAALSPRERDVLEQLIGGASNKLAARALGISPRTIEMHRARMVQRLGASTTAEALEIARLAGVKRARAK